MVPISFPVRAPRFFLIKAGTVSRSIIISFKVCPKHLTRVVQEHRSSAFCGCAHGSLGAEPRGVTDPTRAPRGCGIMASRDKRAAPAGLARLHTEDRLVSEETHDCDAKEAAVFAKTREAPRRALTPLRRAGVDWNLTNCRTYSKDSSDAPEKGRSVTKAGPESHVKGHSAQARTHWTGGAESAHLVGRGHRGGTPDAPGTW